MRLEWGYVTKYAFCRTEQVSRGGLPGCLAPITSEKCIDALTDRVFIPKIAEQQLTLSDAGFGAFQKTVGGLSKITQVEVSARVQFWQPAQQYMRG